MEIKPFNTSKITRTTDAYSQAVIAGNFIFVSGTPGIDPGTGKIISEDFEEQTRRAFSNLSIVLAEAGSDMSKVVKTTIFMVARNDFTVINKVYKDFFPHTAPARSVPQVLPFPAGILISVECIAAI